MKMMKLSGLEHFSMETISENIGITPLMGVIQHYDWGGHNFIPELIGVDNESKQPFAELWMGAHHRGPSILHLQGNELDLPHLIKQFPEVFLGEKIIRQFGKKLPFLFKILDVNRMLSIQSHPTKAKAEKGFSKENEQGIPHTAPHRNYKDDNHKPEIAVALTDFWLLHGFKPSSKITAILHQVPEFKELAEIFQSKDLFTLYKTIMEWPQKKVNQVLHPLGERLLAALESQELELNQEDYWAALRFKEFTAKQAPIDRGIFSIYLFNLVNLHPGEGIFQAAGIPHAYLRGVTVELMANSDNVFRGGLTSKHVDVSELLDNLIFESVDPQIMSGQSLSETEVAYPSPAPDFELRKIEISKNQIHHNASTNSPSIIILLEGEVIVNDQLKLNKGEILFIPPNLFCTIENKSANATLFKALVP